VMVSFIKKTLLDFGKKNTPFKLFFYFKFFIIRKITLKDNKKNYSFFF